MGKRTTGDADSGGEPMGRKMGQGKWGRVPQSPHKTREDGGWAGRMEDGQHPRPKPSSHGDAASGWTWDSAPAAEKQALKTSSLVVK